MATHRQQSTGNKGQVIKVVASNPLTSAAIEAKLPESYRGVWQLSPDFVCRNAQSGC